MRGETRPDAGGGMCLCPLQQLHHGIPVGLFLEGGGERLHSGHDERIGRIGQQPLDGEVAAVDALQCLGSSGHPGQPGMAEPHRERARGSGEQRAELPLGGLERRVGHVVHEGNDDGAVPWPVRAAILDFERHRLLETLPRAGRQKSVKTVTEYRPGPRCSRRAPPLRYRKGARGRSNKLQRHSPESDPPLQQNSASDCLSVGGWSHNRFVAEGNP